MCTSTPIHTGSSLPAHNFKSDRAAGRRHRRARPADRGLGLKWVADTPTCTAFCCAAGVFDGLQWAAAVQVCRTRPQNYIGLITRWEPSGVRHR
jgi:hypothetical protein